MCTIARRESIMSRAKPLSVMLMQLHVAVFCISHRASLGPPSPGAVPTVLCLYVSVCEYLHAIEVCV